MAAEDADGAPNQEEGLVWEQKAEAYVENLLSTSSPPAPPVAAGAAAAGADATAAGQGQKVLIGVRTRPLLADETPKLGRAIPGKVRGLAGTTRRTKAPQPPSPHGHPQAHREARLPSSTTRPSWRTKRATRSTC